MDSGASPLQVVSIILLLCFLSFAFGWMIRDMKGSRVRRFKVKHLYLHRFRVQKRLIRLAEISKKYNWKGNIN